MFQYIREEEEEEHPATGPQFIMTGCDNQHRCGADSDESDTVNPTDDSTEDVRVWHWAEEGTPPPRHADCWRLPAGHRPRVPSRAHRKDHRTKCARQTLCHSWPQQATGENVELSDIDFGDSSRDHESHLRGGKASSEVICRKQPIQTYCVPVVQNASGACKLRRTVLAGETSVLCGDQPTQRERRIDKDIEPGTTTDTKRLTDSDPTHSQHETPEEYRAYVKEVRRAGRQNFAKQTADLVRRTLQVGNWEDIVRQIPLANQFLSETIETAKSEAMTIYDKHIQDKGSPQRLYKLQEALVKRAVLSLSKRCKGMSNCT
ncbi:PREDICTED: uncharacterized protein LOC109479617 [Branchiostoma belcheri]|uniref:Uncharacterized protein LOC109479617 n=1 Tax=Branchiostoma belcheri TaxID=7741 RepID=A0A6P4ZK40_BRABE|nr:PREDICTED: uncharacterized protein LOC109479617 [Branchiostoma belcheri]